jgi:hypothetical protein
MFSNEFQLLSMKPNLHFHIFNAHINIRPESRNPNTQFSPRQVNIPKICHPFTSNEGVPNRYHFPILTQPITKRKCPGDGSSGFCIDKCVFFQRTKGMTFQNHDLITKLGVQIIRKNNNNRNSFDP